MTKKIICLFDVDGTLTDPRQVQLFILKTKYILIVMNKL